MTVSDSLPQSTTAPIREGTLRERMAGSGATYAIAGATIALFVISAFIAPQSVSAGAVDSMLPFAAVLAMVAMGQTLVIQQGGIDLSVPGTVSLAVVLVTRLPEGQNSLVPMAIAITLGVAAAAGLVTGLIVAYIGVAPIVATLGMNAVLVGATWAISGGSPRSTPSGLHDVVSSSVLGIPFTVVIALVFTALLWLLLKRSVTGRRFEAVGSNPHVALASGLPVRRIEASAYIGAGLLYALGGILLAGIVTTPNTYQGNSYLLTSVAVVVLGGTSLMGGKGSIVATTIAALFLTQVDQLVLTLGLGYATQTLVQAAALGLGVAFHSSQWRTSARDALQRRKRQKLLASTSKIPST